MLTIWRRTWFIQIFPLKSHSQRSMKHVQPIAFEAAERSKFYAKIQPKHPWFYTFTSDPGCKMQLWSSIRHSIGRPFNWSTIVMSKRKLLLLKNPTFQSVSAICEQSQDVSDIVKISIIPDPAFHSGSTLGEKTRGYSKIEKTRLIIHLVLVIRVANCIHGSNVNSVMWNVIIVAKSQSGGYISKELMNSHGKRMSFIVDTGSVESLIPIHALKKF